MTASSLSVAINAQEITIATVQPLWPNNARLALSFSLMFEVSGQPISGAGGVIPDPIEKGLPGLPTNAFFQYGVYEGVPRILDLMDKYQVKPSSFMTGQVGREGAGTGPRDCQARARGRRARLHLAE